MHTPNQKDDLSPKPNIHALNQPAIEIEGTTCKDPNLRVAQLTRWGRDKIKITPLATVAQKLLNENHVGYLEQFEDGSVIFLAREINNPIITSGLITEQELKALLHLSLLLRAPTELARKQKLEWALNEMKEWL